MLRRISLSGLRGRPRQTGILLTTMVLAFFFVTIAMNLLSTSQMNRVIQRREAFGEWRAVLIADSAQKAAELRQNNQAFAASRLIGQESLVGLMASADDAFWDMAHIRLIDGRLPDGPDEIVLTESQLSYFAEPPGPGQTISLTIEVAGSDHAGYVLQDDHIKQVEEDLFQLQQYIAQNWQSYYQQILADQADWQQNQKQYIRDYLTDVWLKAREFDEASEAERYRQMIDGQYDRKIALFEQDPQTPEKRLALIEQFIQSERAITIENELASPWAKHYFHPDYSADELPQAIAAHYQFDALADQYISQAMPRKTSELEAFSGTIVSTRSQSRAVRTSDLKQFSHLFDHLPAITQTGLPQERVYHEASSIRLHRDMVVSGIIENYHQVWDGPMTQYATAFVTPETAELLFEQAVHRSKLAANQAYQPPVHYFLLGEEAVYPEAINLFTNQLGYGQTGNLNEETLSGILLAVIALVTAFSIFQISLIQFRKRLRKLALLRALGATFSQLRQLLSWESVYLIGLALPLGSLLGFITSLGLVWLNNRATGDRLMLQLNPGWLALGYGLTLVSILIGLFIPMLGIRQVSLRGKVEATNKAAAKTTRQKLGQVSQTRQSLASINRRHRRFTRKQQLVHLGLISFSLLILIGSYLLIHLAFGDYRTAVIHANMPDFELEAPFQQSLRRSREFMQQIDELPGVTGSELFVRGIRAFFWYEGISQDELNQTFLQLLPPQMHTDHFGTNLEYRVSQDMADQIEQSAVGDIYGVVPGSELERDLKNMLPPDFDWPAFHHAGEAILLQPSYQLSDSSDFTPLDPARLEGVDRTERMKQVLELAGAGTISYDIRKAAAMEQLPGLEDLSEIVLTIPSGATTGTTNRPLHMVRRYPVNLAQVITHLPQEGFWPLSHTVQNPVLFFSQYQMDQMYPYRMHSSLSFDLINRYLGESLAVQYGSSIIQVNQTDMAGADIVRLKHMAFQNGFQVKSLYLEKKQLFTKGIRSSLIVGLLAATLLLITVQIQTSSFRGQLEAERERIGILQSLGVTEKDFRQAYLVDSIKQVIRAIGLAHGVMFAGLAIYLLFKGAASHWPTDLKIALWDYNWWWHGLIVLLFAGLAGLSSYLPVGRILHRQPVNNIRSLQ